MNAFPTLADLARAPLDDVLHHWTGLGYYARARNLHRAAQLASERHGGALPADHDALQALPGIGRSTAGAILSLGHGQRAAILDGNVKRVLARHAALAGDPARSEVLRRFWALAEARTPLQRAPTYNQAMMDIGALLCTRSRPACVLCPVSADCQARQQGDIARYPEKVRKQAVPRRETVMLLQLNARGEVWMHQRPATGLWGGLWSFPEQAVVPADGEPWPAFEHVFSHFRLTITPVLRRGDAAIVQDISGLPGRWVTLAPLPALGVPAPVQQLLQRLQALVEPT